VANEKMVRVRGMRVTRHESTQRAMGAHRVVLLRIGGGLIWVINAWYQWLPGFLNRFSDQFSRPLPSAPALLKPWLQFWQNLLTPHATFFAVCTVLRETLIAACLILGLGQRAISVVGAVLSFLIWAVPELFGRIWQRDQTDIDTSIISTFIFLALLAVDAGANANGRHWTTNWRRGCPGDGGS